MYPSRIKNLREYLLMLSLLVSAAIACQLSTPAEVIPTPEKPTATPEISTTGGATDDEDTDQEVQTQVVPGLTSAQRQRLAAATVLIIMTQEDRGRLVPFGIGSGTIVSDDGLILTNAHVASPVSQGFSQDEPDALIIALLEEESKPPIPTYIADVLAVDGFLDLAVIQISSTLDGAHVNPDNLNLDFVELGDSDQTHLGDNLNIFGFPGIGGDTITFTRGIVSGFSNQDEIGDRAWFKTDATIAGGNSGGLGANDRAQIVGIPTRGGAGTEISIADCRVVQDTNGDGRLTQNDNCIPIGGFINALRPINLAKPLIRAAQTGVVYESPFRSPSTIAGTPGTGSESFSLISWAEDFDENGCPILPVEQFTPGVTQVSAVFDYSGMTNGEDFGLFWLLDGEVVIDDEFPWDGGENGNCFPFFIHNDGDPMPEGEYTLLLFAGEGLPLIAEETTFVSDSNQSGFDNEISIEGQIIDGDTGKGISGAVIFVLNPGVDLDSWLINGTDEDIFSFAETDRSGFFQLADSFRRDTEYPAVAGAEGYQPSQGLITFEPNDPDLISLEIELTR